jgi:hypothetical protein
MKAPRDGCTRKLALFAAMPHLQGFSRVLPCLFFPFIDGLLDCRLHARYATSTSAQHAKTIAKSGIRAKAFPVPACLAAEEPHKWRRAFAAAFSQAAAAPALPHQRFGAAAVCARFACMGRELEPPEACVGIASTARPAAQASGRSTPVHNLRRARAPCTLARARCALENHVAFLRPLPGRFLINNLQLNCFLFSPSTNPDSR